MSHQSNSTWVDLANLAPLMEFLSPDTEGSFVTQHTTEFRELAARARSLFWDEADHRDLQSTLPDERSVAPLFRPIANLLPNLQALSIICASPLGASQIAPWISSSLTEVDVYVTMGMDDRAATTVLSALDVCSHQLAWFSLTVNHKALRSQAMLHQALLSALRNMKELLVAAVPLYASPHEHLEALSAMPHLEDLTLRLMEPPRGYTSFSDASRHAVSSLLPLEEDLDPLEGLHNLMSLPEMPHANVSATNATARPFPALRTLYIEGTFSWISDIIANNRFPMEYLGLRLQSVQSGREMAQTMEDIVRSCRHLRLVIIHIQHWTQSSWIDVRQLGAVPCIVFVAGTIFRTSNMTLEMVRAVSGQQAAPI